MKKLILMLIVSVFTTAIYAQETKQQRAERILKVNQKKTTAPVVTTTRTVSNPAKEENARKILKVDTRKTIPVLTRNDDDNREKSNNASERGRERSAAGKRRAYENKQFHKYHKHHKHHKKFKGENHGHDED